MELKLPQRIDGKQPAVLPDSRQVTVIGANGSGKTRFCDRLMADAGEKAYRVSALKALYQTTTIDNPLKGSITDHFNQLNAAMVLTTGMAKTEFDQLTYILLAEEFRDLMNFKTQLLLGDEVPFPKTKLDRVVHVWQTVFPKNKVLRENGKIWFSTEGQDDRYAPQRLSDGERAVLYYVGAVLYAMPDAMIVVDDPETFIHRSIMQTLWNVIEELRPDCTFVYSTHNFEFASTRADNQCVWVKAYDPQLRAWDYEVMPTSKSLGDAMYMELLGSRKPVLFIEGDETHSLDSRLYPLLFPEYTVKPLGGCNRVIESVRSFNDLKGFHHLDSLGIVDRDRRTQQEVQYLRRKGILVPDVAEIENMFLIEGVVHAMATMRHRRADYVVSRVRHTVMELFSKELNAQALMHVRHMVKHEVEVRVDRKFNNITALEKHMADLVNEVNPRRTYEYFCHQFHDMLHNDDYAGVLRVYNQKQMLGESRVASLCGFDTKEGYIKSVLHQLKTNSEAGQKIREAIKAVFDLDGDGQVDRKSEKR